MDYFTSRSLIPVVGQTFHSTEVAQNMMRSVCNLKWKFGYTQSHKKGHGTQRY